MKLIIIASLIACSYAAKLDKTYLPPPGSQTSGGSPGSLKTPFGSSGPSSFGQFSNFGGNQGPANGQDQFGYQPGLSSNQVFRGSADNMFGVGSQGPNRPDLDRPEGNQSSGQANFVPEQGMETTQILAGRPQAESDRTAETLRYMNENDGETFAYSFETSNGIAAEENGVATNGVQAQGAFSYIGDDGQMYSVTYTADENGYVPKGDHLPTPPPIPDEILRSLEKNAQAAAAGTQEGAYNPEEDVTTPEEYNEANSPQKPSDPSQQYGVPASAFEASSFNQGPLSNYDSASTSGSTGFAPSSFNRPSLAGSLPSVPAAITGAAPLAPSGPGIQGFAPSGPESSPNLYGSTSLASSFAPSKPAQTVSAHFTPSSATQQFNRPSSSFRHSNIPVQAQDASGYKYNQPTTSGSGHSHVNSDAAIGSFARPTGNARPDAPVFVTQSIRPATSVSNNGFQSRRPTAPAYNDAQQTQYNTGGNFQSPSAPVTKPQYNAANNVPQATRPTSVSKAGQPIQYNAPNTVPSNDQPTQYYDANNGFQAARPISVSGNGQSAQNYAANNEIQANRPTSVSSNGQNSQYYAANNELQDNRRISGSNNGQPTQYIQRPSNNIQPSQYNAVAKVQSSKPSQAVSTMPEYQNAPYQYNQPKPQSQRRPQSSGNQVSGPYNPVASQIFNQGGQTQVPQQPQEQGSQNQGLQNQVRPGQDFRGPMQQPSFSPEEGYKY